MNITEDITKYTLVNKRMTGTTLKLFFRQHIDDKPQKVLELKNIAAFIDNFNNQQLGTIEIRDLAGSYGMDMAMQLKRPEIKNYHEVFIFANDTFSTSVFRALAENVTWRDYDDHRFGDNNY